MTYKLSQEPASGSYKEDGHDGVLLVHVDSGPPRLRKDKAKSNPIVSLVWSVTYSDFIFLLAAYRLSRDEDWEIPFVSLEAGHGDYLCRVLPGTFGWRPDGAEMYSVFCSVEVFGEA